MWSFAEKALRSPIEVVCCSTESPQVGRDQSGQKLQCWRCGRKKKALPRHWWTDWLIIWRADYQAGWLTGRQLKGKYKCSQDREGPQGKWRCWWWLVGRVGAGLVSSLPRSLLCRLLQLVMSIVVLAIWVLILAFFHTIQILESRGGGDGSLTQNFSTHALLDKVAWLRYNQRPSWGFDKLLNKSNQLSLSTSSAYR